MQLRPFLLEPTACNVGHKACGRFPPRAVEMGLKQHEAPMPRFLLLAGIVLLIGDYSFAQDSPDPTPLQCQLIRLAVAQYGFAAARRHALETYGPEAVKTGDKCFTNVGLRLRARTKRHGE